MIMFSQSTLGLAKVKKLKKPQDFMQWGRRVNVVISRDESTTMSLEDTPEEI